MKKLLLMLLSLAILLTFSACSGEESGDNKGTGSLESTETTDTEGSKFSFAVASADNFKIKIDMDMSEVLTALGEPLKYFEATSCAFEGLDKTYTYAGFIVTTRPEGEKDFVNSILLTDDSVTTPEGSYIGSSPDSIKSVYGAPSEETETLLAYEDGNTVLNFILKDGAVISIEYLPK